MSDRELKMASQIIDSLTTEWKPSRYHDTYRERVLELIKKKSKGQEIVADKETSAAPSNVVDLMAALEASLAKSKKPAGRAKKATRKATKRRPAAKKAASKSASKSASRRTRVAASRRCRRRGGRPSPSRARRCRCR